MVSIKPGDWVIAIETSDHIGRRNIKKGDVYRIKEVVTDIMGGNQITFCKLKCEKDEFTSWVTSRFSLASKDELNILKILYE